MSEQQAVDKTTGLSAFLLAVIPSARSSTMRSMLSTIFYPARKCLRRLGSRGSFTMVV
jgi:hypothetical protein